MKKPVTLTWMWAWILYVVFTAIINILVILIPAFDFPTALLSGLWLFVLPGWLLQHSVFLRTHNFWEKLGFSIGLSLLAIMVAALTLNGLLPLFGERRPLNAYAVLFWFDAIWTIIFAFSWWQSRHNPIRFKFTRLPTIDWLVPMAAIPAVILSVLGAISLNNAGPNTFTLVMLLYIAGYLAVLIRLRDKLAENALLVGIYLVGLALLLMTSLRGWFTTGHDVQAEFRVFTLALTNLRWDMSSLRDAYNACLSITLLPTVVHQIMGVDAVYVFKTVYQAIFALVPVLVFLIARNYSDRFVALLASIYFMAFPTFFGDMPMLNRQEIAFFFIALIFLTMANRRWSLRRRRWIIILFGGGVVLSHYSTTYTMIATFLMVVLARATLDLIARVIRPRTSKFNKYLNRWQQPKRGPVNLAIVVALVVVSYVWSTQLTSTGGNLARVITETVSSIGKGVVNDMKSSDTGYSLFAKVEQTDQQRLQTFVDKSIPEIKANSSNDYPYLANAYPSTAPKVVEEPDMPLSQWGSTLSSWGLNVSDFNYLVRQSSAVVLQLLLAVGVIMLFFRRTRNNVLTHEYALFQVASVGMLAAIVILPVLSAEYGLLRAFQQILLISGAAIAVASISLVPKRWHRARVGIPSVLAISFFISSTGIITTLLGGYPAQLHLENSGKYYDLYYSHATEQSAAKWVSTAALFSYSPGSTIADVEADRPTFGKVSSNPQIALQGDNYPALIHRDAFVFLGYTTVTQGLATVTYNGDPLHYRYPTNYLDEQKDLIYSNNGARIYR